LPGIAERRLGFSLYAQPAELVLGAPSSRQEAMQQAYGPAGEGQCTFSGPGVSIARKQSSQGFTA